MSATVVGTAPTSDARYTTSTDLTGATSCCCSTGTSTEMSGGAGLKLALCAGKPKIGALPTSADQHLVLQQARPGSGIGCSVLVVREKLSEVFERFTESARAVVVQGGRECVASVRG
jgi:hypothetical protein